MYRDTITLFNRNGNQWRATVLTNVDLNADRANILATYGANSQDRAKLHIKYDGDDVQGHTYKEPKKYTGDENEITFRSGEDFDFFMEGEYDGDTLIDDEEYINGFYNYMNATRDAVYAISSVAKYTVIPHFEIMGK